MTADLLAQGPVQAAAVRAWRRPGLVGALTGWVVFHALVQVLVLGASACGWRLDKTSALTMLAVAATVGILAACRCDDRVGSGIGAEANGPANAWPWRLLGWTALAWLAWIFLQSLALTALRPPLDWDGLYYHLPALNGWTLARRVCWLDGVGDLLWPNGYPMGVEAFGLLLRFALGTSSLVDAGNLAYWPLALLGVAALSGQMGARRPSVCLAAALLVGAPVFVAQSVTCYTDPAFAACVMAALALTARLWTSPRPGAVQVAVAGAAVGLVAGVKGAGAPYAVVIGLAMAVRLVALGGQNEPEDPEPSARRPERPWLLAGLHLVVLALAAAVVGGYWYARNVIHTGNPVFPIQVRLGGLTLAEGYDPARMLIGNMPPWLAKVPPLWRLPYSWLQTDAPIGGYAPTGGLGFVWLLGGLPAIALLWIRRRRWLAEPARRTLALLTVLTVALLVVQPANWWARFTVWVHALGLPAIAVTLSALSSGAGQRREGSRGPTLRVGASRPRTAGRPADGARQDGAADTEDTARSAKAGRWAATRRAFALVAAVGLLGVAVWESQTALSMAWRWGQRPHAPLVTELFLPTDEAFFAGLADSTGGRGPQGFLAASRLARSRWGRVGTLLGGTLAMPLGARDVALLPDAIDAAVVDRLRREGRTWIVWDVTGAGPVPAILRQAAPAELTYRRPPDTDFHFLRLAAP